MKYDRIVTFECSIPFGHGLDNKHPGEQSHIIYSNYLYDKVISTQSIGD